METMVSTSFKSELDILIQSRNWPNRIQQNLFKRDFVRDSRQISDLKQHSDKVLNVQVRAKFYEFLLHR